MVRDRPDDRGRGLSGRRFYDRRVREPQDLPHSDLQPRALYRLTGIEPDIEQKWHEYAIAMVVFGWLQEKT
jgi:hypothetical protein